ncbi:MAG: translation elongation factor 4 [Planctomycetota bacterium]|nr:translation elongation factor 4 [Planctomycetota bacterium]
MESDLNLRNFCIIAHIDHGKSTLADRFIQRSGQVAQREFCEQLLDGMELERERGITIKASAVALDYTLNSKRYRFNLIDTPGHVDFSYEVSRALKACEGAVLLVDAAQGVEAQTISNFYLALEEGLTIIPALNKIDLAAARIKEVKEEIETILGLEKEEVLEVSAKTGQGLEALMQRIVEKIPSPERLVDALLRALVFDAQYDEYRGVVVYVRVFNGSIRRGDRIRLLSTGSTYEVSEVGVFRPKMTPQETLSAGEVGYVIAGIKRIQDVHVGETLTSAEAEGVEPLPGYREPKPMVFCSFFPGLESDSQALKRALERLQLNDAAIRFEPTQSEALGYGFRCGFLGLLHMEIAQERLERELNVDVVQTAPSTSYQVLLKTGELENIETPSKLPTPDKILEVREPMMEVSIVLPNDYIGAVMRLCEIRRGTLKSTQYLGTKRCLLVFKMPLAEIIYDFYDKLKSITRGLATMDYEFKGYEKADLVKLDILIAGKRADPLSMIVHRSKAYETGKSILKVLRKEIPRHLFDVVLQAAIGSRIIAKESIRAMAKNVTAKCYGGDITRKMKLLKKQREGKKRMKQIGQVTVPQSAFRAVLRRFEE